MKKKKPLSSKLLARWRKLGPGLVTGASDDDPSGIATYSQDLVNALSNQFNNSFTCSICALESETEQHIYKETPKYILNIFVRPSFLFIVALSPNPYNVLHFFKQLQNTSLDI